MAPHLQIPGGGGGDDNNRAHPLASSEPGGGISSSEETEELRGLGRVHVHVEEDLQHTSHTPPLEAADMKNKVVASSEDLLELRCLWPHHTPASHQLATRYESLLGARRRTSASSSPQSALFSLILHAARTYTQTQFATYKRILKATTWILVFVLYIYYVVAQLDAYRAFNTHQGASEMLFRTVPDAFDKHDEAVSYVHNALVKQAWNDPVCGDGTCEAPYEMPVAGSMAGRCAADCGIDRSGEVDAVVRVASDFRHPRVSSEAMRRTARWNLP
ncbi:hypothetical protein RI054_04g20440 [Pseudoscourfieldia marina]